MYLFDFVKLKFQIEAAQSLPPGCTYALNRISITPSDVMRRDGWQCAQTNKQINTRAHIDTLTRSFTKRPQRTKITKWWCRRKNMPSAISQIKPNQYQLLRPCRRFVYFWLCYFLHLTVFGRACVALASCLFFGCFGSAVAVCHGKRFAGVARTLQNSIEIYGIKFVSFHLFNVRAFFFCIFAACSFLSSRYKVAAQQKFLGPNQA